MPGRADPGGVYLWASFSLAAVLQVVTYPAPLSDLSPTACGTVLREAHPGVCFPLSFLEKWRTSRPPGSPPSHPALLTEPHHILFCLLLLPISEQRVLLFRESSPPCPCLSAKKMPGSEEGFPAGAWPTPRCFPAVPAVPLAGSSDPSQLSLLPSGTSRLPRRLTFGFEDTRAVSLRCSDSYAANTPVHMIQAECLRIPTYLSVF